MFSVCAYCATTSYDTGDVGETGSPFSPLRFEELWFVFKRYAFSRFECPFDSSKVVSIHEDKVNVNLLEGFNELLLSPMHWLLLI